MVDLALWGHGCVPTGSEEGICVRKTRPPRVTRGDRSRVTRRRTTPWYRGRWGTGEVVTRDPLEGRGKRVHVSINGNTAALRCRSTMSPEIDRIAELAREDKQRQFLSIAHLLTPKALLEAFEGLRKDASAGVDGLTHKEYAGNAAEKILQLHERLKSGRYRAQPLRRVYIPKEGGKERPISIPSLEDKIAQKATVTLLNAIYEQDFLPTSYGFRPGRSPHDALDELDRIIFRRPISYILEADICGYFDAIVRDLLMEMVERRVKDGSVLRLIRKWIHIGVIEQGRLLTSETGTGQGQIVSPLLANIYLHYVLDQWFKDEVQPRLRGESYQIRYADDFVLCFQFQEDATKVMEVLTKRFAKYGLTLHPEKTRLIEFGRAAVRKAVQPGNQEPATFDFLGFTHIAARGRNGTFMIQLQTMRKRLKRGLRAITEWCRANRHMRVEQQRKVLNQKIRGHYQYYGRRTNYRSLKRFFRATRKIWKCQLNRRTRGNTMTWLRFERLEARYPLAPPHITHARVSQGSCTRRTGCGKSARPGL